MLYDLHMHTHLSDGQMDPSDIERLAKERFSKGGIADHVSPYHKIKDEKTFNHYLKVIGKYDILKGCELCIGPTPVVSEELLSELDYVIGSVHSLNFGDGLNFFFFDRVLRFPDIPVFIQKYIDTVIEAINTLPIDILGHPLMLPLFLQKNNPQELFSDEQIESIVKAGVDNGVAFEISSRWRVPDERFLKICSDLGATFSFGSDAHLKDDAFNLDYPLQMFEAASLSMDRVFIPKKSS
jgi:putative hydrolase